MTAAGCNGALNGGYSFVADNKGAALNAVSTNKAGIVCSGVAGLPTGNARRAVGTWFKCTPADLSSYGYNVYAPIVEFGR